MANEGKVVVTVKYSQTHFLLYGGVRGSKSHKNVNQMNNCDFVSYQFHFKSYF
jgi:alkyl sulfatase BDS1-like metallo-beta-lactamase superfamily hydrolase